MLMSNCIWKIIVFFPHVLFILFSLIYVSLCFLALIRIGVSLQTQNKLQEARAIFVECYERMSAFYNPIHPIVIEAGNYLIKLLIETKEYEDAERYARICYESLTRPYTESNATAIACDSLSLVTLKLLEEGRNSAEYGDLVEAEMLIRKAIDMKNSINGVNHSSSVISLTILSDILRFKGEVDSLDMKAILKQVLAIEVPFLGKDAMSVATSNNNLAISYYKSGIKLPPGGERTKELDTAATYIREAIRINLEVKGPGDVHTLAYQGGLVEIMGCM